MLEIQKQIEANEVKQNLQTTQVDNDANKEKVSPNTVLVLEKFYQKCSYTVVEETVMPYDLVNLTQEEVQNKYSDWKIREFNQKEIIMYKVFEERCDEHYIVKANEGFLDIYKENEDGTLELIELTDISIQYLENEDIQKLQQGIKVHGKVELEKLLEDYNS